jgi:REP element-mobilizing transposase RayT
VQKWYYLFDRFNRWEILSNSLKYCQINKGLKIYGYVFMLNHIHLLVYADNVADFIRDLKKFTSKEIKKNILENESHVLELFLDKKTKEYSFWQESNQPKVIENEKYFLQKLRYVWDNPVRKGYVLKPENWKWSSANDESEIKCEKLF